jgi:hypothetical protein
MLESMLEDKNKQNAMSGMNHSMMSMNPQTGAIQVGGNRVPPHQTTSSTANGSIFTTLPNFVGGMQPQQAQPVPGHRYNTRRSTKGGPQPGDDSSAAFPHLWHGSHEEGGSPNHMDHYQQHYSDDQFTGAWHQGEAHHGK